MIRSSFPRGRLIYFVTGNVHKFEEARRVLAEYKVATAMLKIKTTEIQDESIENIAKTSVIDAVKKCGLPIIVEDAGLFIKTLNGFPGPYSSYVYRTIGTRGVLKLMKDVQEREAYFKSVVAYSIPKELLKCFEAKCFEGKVEGRISEEERGEAGFGFDPIFTPLNRSHRTFAEMTTEEKNKYSHRARALRKFAEWYASSF